VQTQNLSLNLTIPIGAFYPTLVIPVIVIGTVRNTNKCQFFKEWDFLPLFYLYGLFLSVETTINIGLSLLRF
jgi:hypothetical protein